MALNFVELQAGADQTPTTSKNKKPIEYVDLQKMRLRYTRESKPTLNRKGEVETINNPRMPETLRENFANDLTNDLERLIQIRTDPQINLDQFNYMLTNPNHAHFRRIYDTFVKSEFGTNGRVLKIDTKALNEFLTTDAGLEVAYLIRAQKMQERALSSALLFSFNIPESEPGTLRGENVEVTKGNALYRLGGNISRWLEAPLGEVNGRMQEGWMHDNPIFEFNDRGRVVLSVGGAALLGGVLGTVFLGPALGPAGTAIGAAVPPALAEFLHLCKPGQEIEPRQVMEAWRSITENMSPTERLWMQKFHRVDPDDFRITRRAGIFGARDVIEPVPNRIRGTRIDADTLEKEFRGDAFALLQYQKATGVPKEYQSPMGMDLKWLFDTDGRRMPPQQGTEVEQRILERFRASGGIRQGLVSREIEDPPHSGRWIANPAFPNHARLTDADIRANVQRFRNAFEAEIFSSLERALQSIVDNKTDYLVNIQSKITEKRTLFAPGSDRADKQKKSLEKEAEQLTKEKEPLQEGITSLAEFQEKAKNSRDVIEEAEEKKRAAERQVAPPLPPGAIDIEQALDNVKSLSALPGGGIPEITIIVALGPPLKTERITSLVREEEQLDNDKNAAYSTYKRARIDPYLVPTIPNPPDIAVLEQRGHDVVESRFKGRTDALNRKKILIEKLYKDITESEETIQENRRTLQNRYGEPRRTTEATISSMSTEFTTIEGWNVPGINLSIIALQTEPFDTLMQRINLVRWNNAANGWTQAENSLPQNQRRLLLAIAEAKAIQIDPTLATPTTGLGSFTEATDTTNTWALSEAALISYSREEIQQHQITNGRTVLGAAAAMTNQEVDAIKQEAARRLKTRSRGLQEAMKPIAVRGTAIASEKASIDANGVPSPLLDTAARIVGEKKSDENVKEEPGRLDIIRDTLSQMSMQQFNEFFSESMAFSLPGLYTSEEQKLPIAFVNLYNLMFGHRGENQAQYIDPTTGQIEIGHDAALKRNLSVVTAENLLIALNRHYNLNITNPAVNGLDVLHTLRGRLGLTTIPGVLFNITKEQLAEFLTDEVINQTLAPRIDAL